MQNGGAEENLVYLDDEPSRFGNGTWAGAGTIDTALPEAGVAPEPAAPPGGVLQDVLTAGAGRATRPVPRGTVEAVVLRTVVELPEEVVTFFPDPLWVPV